jgi:hypothetical protein
MTSATCGTPSDVTASLTPNRRGRVVENDQYADVADVEHDWEPRWEPHG